MTELFAQLNHRLQRVRGVRGALEPEVAGADLVVLADRVVAYLSADRSFAEFASWLLNNNKGSGLSELSLRAAHVAYACGVAPSGTAGTVEPPQPPRRPPLTGEERPPCFDSRVLSFNALRRARTTLDDFSKFYMPLHGLSQLDFFRWLPTLVFSEACIYQLDEDNEELARRAQLEPDTAAGSSAAEVAMRAVLTAEGLMNEQVLRQLEDGASYWAMERRLCAAMARGEPIELEEVLRASSLKSFDYRILHALLGALSAPSASQTASQGESRKPSETLVALRAAQVADQRVRRCEHS